MTFNSELNKTRRDDIGSIPPGKILKGDSDEMLCSCGGARAAAFKCLKGIRDDDFSELAEKKRKCANEILSDPSLLPHA